MQPRHKIHRYRLATMSNAREGALAYAVSLGFAVTLVTIFVKVN
jgi:hypothetical protein